MARPAPQRVERLEVASDGNVILTALQLFTSLLLVHLAAQVAEQMGTIAAVIAFISNVCIVGGGGGCVM